MTENSTEAKVGVRTHQEILDRVREIQRGGMDFFGAETGDLVYALPFELAREWLREDATESDWTQVTDPHEAASEYLDFAVGKALDHRGLSAGRSISHYRAWVWLLGKEDSVDWEDYAMYGCPILLRVSQVLELELPDQLTNDENSLMFERMARGQRCSDDCQGGC